MKIHRLHAFFTSYKISASLFSAFFFHLRGSNESLKLYSFRIRAYLLFLVFALDISFLTLIVFEVSKEKTVNFALFTQFSIHLKILSINL